jgi:hypothetical protein
MSAKGYQRNGTLYHKLNQARFEKFVVDTYPAGVLHWRQRVLDHKLDVDVDVYLLQRQPHGSRLGVCEHDELDVGRGLVVVQLVLRGAVGQETATDQSLQLTRSRR